MRVPGLARKAISVGGQQGRMRRGSSFCLRGGEARGLLQGKERIGGLRRIHSHSLEVRRNWGYASRCQGKKDGHKIAKKKIRTGGPRRGDAFGRKGSGRREKKRKPEKA